MLTKVRANIDTKEALAVIGAGFFVFGVWQIYPPAAHICAGITLIIPFAMSVKR